MMDYMKILGKIYKYSFLINKLIKNFFKQRVNLNSGEDILEIK